MAADGVAFKGCKVEHATDKAVLVQLSGGRKIWVPQSQVHDDSDVWKKGDEGTLVVKSWWAEKEGLDL